MQTVKLVCHKYHRNDDGQFWISGEVYELDRYDVHGFILERLAGTTDESRKAIVLANLGSPGVVDLITQNINVLFEHFRVVDQADFDKKILGVKGKEIGFVSTPATPMGQRQDGMIVEDLIAELLKIQSDFGPDVKVFISDRDYGYLGVTSVDAQDDGGVFIAIE